MKRAFGVNPDFVVEYISAGITRHSTSRENSDYSLEYEVSDGAIKCSIIPKTAISLVKVSVIGRFDFKAGDVFFGNGYQSWTTTSEYNRNDKMLDITPMAAISPLRNLAGISSDCRFVDAPKTAGVFISHCYTYVRNGEEVTLIGSLTEKQGFTVFTGNMVGNFISVSKDVEGVTIKDKYELFDLFITEGTYDEVFDAYFSAMKVSKPAVDHLSGYTSWYNYFQKIDENIILRDLDALDRVRDSVSIFQVDDGYETFVGDWEDPNPEKFPHGMGYIAQKIHEKGYKAGIWLAPFSVQIKSRTYKEHPDWIIRKKGKPVLGCPGWGGAYTLDIYNEEARNYIKQFFDTVLNKWGYDLVKLDFLYSQCIWPRNGKSRGTIMCEAMDFLRECCGDKLILGCGVPLGAAFGRVDACRISCDVDLAYTGKFYNALNVNNEIPSAQNAIRNSIFRRHLNGRVFCNDPDVFFLRYSNLKFNMEQKKVLAFINHIFGDVLFVSDCANEYTANDVELCKKAFAPSDGVKVISAGYESADNILIKYSLDGAEKQLRFNLKTGVGNIDECF